METQLSEPYFPIGKSSSMLQAINYFPVNRPGGIGPVNSPNNAIIIIDPVEALFPNPVKGPREFRFSNPVVSPPETAHSAIEKPTIFTPKNIMIGTVVICLFIVIVKSK